MANKVITSSKNKKRKSSLPASYVKTMAAITVSGFVGAALLETTYKEDEPGLVGVRGRCRKVLEQAQAASKLWGTVTDPEILRQLKHELEEFRRLYLGDRIEVVQLTSTALMMLEDVQKNLVRRDRIEALDRLMATVQWIHNFHEAPVEVRDEAPMYAAANSVEQWIGGME